MPTWLVALDEGSDIPLDRAMVVVGRHPQCDARLDSLRVSRHHCCMTSESGEVLVRDLGSTNGIRINGQRVEFGRLRTGDELSIAHIRYRVDNGMGHDLTKAESASSLPREFVPGIGPPMPPASAARNAGADALAAAVRGLLPASMADRCNIQVIVQKQDGPADPGRPDGCRPD